MLATTGRSIGAYLGLVPTESSSGATRSQGAITKTGNGHARRLLIEAAWQHRRPYRPGVALRRRWDKAGPAARARGQQGNRRLHARWNGFEQRRKRPVRRCQSPISTANPNAVSVDTPRRHPSRVTTAV